MNHVLNAGSIWPDYWLEIDLFYWTTLSGIVGRQNGSLISSITDNVVKDMAIDFLLLCLQYAQTLLVCCFVSVLASIWPWPKAY
jgi:energy-converting hydrogenase Eha subunit H